MIESIAQFVLTITAIRARGLGEGKDSDCEGVPGKVALSGQGPGGKGASYLERPLHHGGHSLLSYRLRISYFTGAWGGSRTRTELGSKGF